MATLHNLLLLTELNSTIVGVYNNPTSRNHFASLCQFHGRDAVVCATIEDAINELGANHENFQHIHIFTQMELAQANQFQFIHFVHQLINRPLYVTYNNDAILQTFRDEAIVHGAFNHLTLVRWIEEAPDFGILANIHAHYVQTPQGQQALATLNANIPVVAQDEVPLEAPPVEAPAQANAFVQIPLNAYNVNVAVAAQAEVPAEAPAQANAAAFQIPPDFGILASIYAQYVQTPQGQQALAILNAHIPQNVDLPVAAQADVPQGAPPVEEPAILALNAQIPAEAHAQAIQIQLNAPVEEPAIQAPAVQHQDVDDDDIDTTLSLGPPAQRRRLE